MGVFNRPLQLTSMDDKRSLDRDAMVSTIASYTIVPARLLRELGVDPTDKIALVLADGQPVEMDRDKPRPPSTAEAYQPS